MAARDKFGWNLKCLPCGTSGHVSVSEDDYPFMRDPNFTVDRIDGEFYVKTAGKNSATIEIACKRCTAIVG